MSDNSFSSYPTPPKNPGDIPSQAKNQKAPKGQVELIKIPRNIETQQAQTNKAERIEGRVVRSDPQTNRVTIRTPQGDVEVQFPKERPLPPRGTPVELRLPRPQAASQTATLTQLPSPATKPEQQLPLNTQKTPAARTYQPPAKTMSTTLPSQPSLQNGETVRLQPLPPALIPQITTQIPPATAQTTLSSQLPPSPALPPSTGQGSVLTNTLFTALPVNTPQFGNVSLPSILQTSFPQAQHSLSAPPILSPATSINSQLSLLLQSTQSFDFSLSEGPPLSTKTEALTSQRPFIINPAQVQNNSVFVVPKGETLSLPQILQASPQLFSASNIALNNSSPAHLPAQVTGTLPQGPPVISIQLSANTPPLFFTAQNVTAPIGTTFAIPVHDLVPLQSLQSSAAANTTPPLSLRTEQLFQTSSWPALNEFVETLQLSSPQLAQQITNIIPSARSPAQIPPAMLLFIAAVRGGDFGAWLGDKPLELMRRLGKGDLVNRLGSDFSNISKASAEALPQEWKGVIFPFQGDAQLHNISLFYKHEENSRETDEDKKQTRFIFDMDLSRMGAVQIDGLFNPVDKQSIRLDLMVRTEAPLSETMKQSMRQNYHQVLRDTGISGDLSFQDKKENFIKVIEEKENLEFTT